MKREVDYEKAWKRAMAELTKTVSFHEGSAGEYGANRLKEFRDAMKKIRKQCIGYRDIGGESHLINTKSFRRWIRRNNIEKPIGHYDFEKRKARAVK